MRKTFEAVDRHTSLPSAFLALRPEANGCSTAIPELDAGIASATDLDRVVSDVDPDVIVQNHRFEAEVLDDTPAVHEEYPVVHIRHGASVGRGEVRNTTRDLGDVVDLALAPGERWATVYREAFPSEVDVASVGIPEADILVGTEPPRERRVLYAPTNHNYGGGSYLTAAEHVLDTFAGSKYELRFRPHPMDRREEPGRLLTKRCRERIEDLPNITFDDSDTPQESMREADLLISDLSGIIPEWLHTGRPLVQLTDTAADADLPELGYQTDQLTLDLVDRLYEDGYPDEVGKRVGEMRSGLGIPMDGRAGERAAREVVACTQ